MRRIRRSGDFFNAVVARMQAAAAIQVVGATALAFGNMLRIELADGCSKGTARGPLRACPVSRNARPRPRMLAFADLPWHPVSHSRMALGNNLLLTRLRKRPYCFSAIFGTLKPKHQEN